MRVIDVLGAAFGLIVLSPLLAAIAVVVKLTSAGPVFYGATRIGRDGRPFKLWKFRSMRVGADRGAAVTTANDSRVTRVGRLLRRYKVDELPQLWNVVTGDMALVGPRPEAPKYVEMYTPEQRAILNVRPGITSAASLQFRNEEALLTGDDWEERYVREVFPAKLRIDLEYIRRRTVASDLALILATIRRVLF